MGTRHIVCIKLDNEYKVSQFGSMGGHPDGAGISCINRIRNILDNLGEFKQKLKNVELVEYDEKVPYNQEIEIVIPASNVIDLIANSSKKIKLYPSIEYTGDSSCNWAYVLDLDENKFKVYEGQNEDKSKEAKEFAKYANPKSTYCAVSEVKSYDIFNLPSKEDFLKFYHDIEIERARERGEL